MSSLPSILLCKALRAQRKLGWICEQMSPSWVQFFCTKMSLSGISPRFLLLPLWVVSQLAVGRGEGGSILPGFNWCLPCVQRARVPPAPGSPGALYPHRPRHRHRPFPELLAAAAF